MKRWIQMMWLSGKLGKRIPVKLYCGGKFRISRTGSWKIQNRIVVGNKSGTLISGVPVCVSIEKDAELTTEDGFNIGPGVNLILKPSSKMFFGKNTYITCDAHIESVNYIQVGSDCAISWGTTIIDSDHHCLLSNEKKELKNESVVIGNHVWIGCNVTILKNTEVGDNCVIAAGSIVSGKYPAGSLIAGNPARVVKSDINWE